MRVIHVMRESEEIYGAERVILAELAKQRADGLDAQFLMLEETRIEGRPDKMGKAVTALGVPLIRVPVHSQISWGMIRDVRDRLRGANADVIHTHGYKGDFIGLLGGRLAKIPVVGEVSGWLFPKRDLQIRFYEWLDVQTLKRMDRILVLSDHYRRLTMRMGMGWKVRLVPSGVDIEGLRARAGKADLRARLGLAPGTPLVGMLSRLSLEKGVDLFVEAMAYVARRLPDARGVVFGTGPEEARLKEQARRLGLEQHLIWAGYCAEAMDALLSLDVVALTSRFEALPQTLMEAMVMKRPAVVTPVGGCPELVLDGETGIVTPNHDPERIASAFCHLLSKPELARQMGERGARRIEENYTMDHWSRRTLAVYEGLLKASKN
jgi:glycosyltransferase involved in cell wall biosynthesis